MCGAYFEKLQQLTKEETEKMTEELTTFTITTSDGTGGCITTNNNANNMVCIPAAANNGMQFVFVDDAEGDAISMDELGLIATLHYKFAELAENFFENYFEDEYCNEEWYENEEACTETFAEGARYYKDSRIGALMNG